MDDRLLMLAPVNALLLLGDGEKEEDIEHITLTGFHEGRMVVVAIVDEAEGDDVSELDPMLAMSADAAEALARVLLSAVALARGASELPTGEA